MTATPPPTHDLREAVAPVVHKFRINESDPCFGQHVEVEENTWFVHAHEFEAYRDWANSELARLTVENQALNDEANTDLDRRLADRCQISEREACIAGLEKDVARLTGERDEAREALRLVSQAGVAFADMKETAEARALAAEAELATLKAAAALKPC